MRNIRGIVENLSSAHLKSYQEDVESRFMEQCIDHCTGMIRYLAKLEKKGEINQGISKILQIIYILDYSKKIVGPSRSKKFLQSNIFSTLNPILFFDNWKLDDEFDNKFVYVLNKIKESGFKDKNIFDSIDEKNLDFVNLRQQWRKFSLDLKERDEINKKIDKDMIFQYRLIDSDVDRERRELVRKIVDYVNTHGNIIKETRIGALIFAYTKKCRNKCRHCMIRKPNCEPFVLTKERIKEVLDASYDYGILAVDSSGGEPLLALDSVLFVVENAKMPQIFITTSANVVGRREQLEEVVDKIWTAFSKNNLNRYLAVQISLDKFHQEVIRKKDDTLRENAPLILVADMLEILFRKYPEIRVNIFTLRSEKEYIFKYLLRELERRDIKIVDMEEAFRLWKKLTGEIPEKGMDILQIVLKFKVDMRIVEVHCGVQSVSKLVYANALAPWEYLGSPYSFDDFKEMKEADKLWMESNMLFVEADGNVFLGGHLEGAWSLGCLAEESMSRIIDSARFDPIVYYINHNFGQIVRWVEELEPNIRDELNEHPTGMSVMNRVLGDAAIRLYLTKKILLFEKGKLYPKELFESLNIEDNVETLKKEYYSKKLSRDRYY